MRRYLVIAAVSLAFAGALIRLSVIDARRFPQRGRSIRSGIGTLNLLCTGAGSPTVILESGLGISSIGWAAIQPEIAKYARVCSYDRAGYGWSEPGPEPRTSKQIAVELKALLDAAGERGPYVLAGASAGGFHVRVFRGLYPSQAAGVVLIDASHEDERDRVDRIVPAEVRERRKKNQPEGPALFDRILASLQVTFGVERLKAALRPASPPPFGLSREWMDEIEWLEAQPKSREAVAAEERSARESAAQARASGNLGSLPLVVLTAGKMEFAPDPLFTTAIRNELRNLWINGLQAELARHSTRGKQIVLADSGHTVQFERPDAVVSAIHEVWSAAKSTEAPR